jgi:hypothetical protein
LFSSKNNFIFIPFFLEKKKWGGDKRGGIKNLKTKHFVFLKKNGLFNEISGPIKLYNLSIELSAERAGRFSDWPRFPRSGQVASRTGLALRGLSKFIVETLDLFEKYIVGITKTDVGGAHTSSGRSSEVVAKPRSN